MSKQQECPDNGKLSWQEPAVIQLCYESEVFGADCSLFGSGADEGCTTYGNNAFLWCDEGNAH